MDPAFEEYIDEEVEIESEEIIAVEDIIEEPPAKRKQSLILEQQKKEISKQVKSYTCLWDKKDKLYRNLVKRNAAWDKIAKEMSISVVEAKNIWKKAKDTYRYLNQKAKKSSKTKSGDAAPEESDEERDDEQELCEEMSFLKENATSSQRQTVSLGGDDTAVPESSTAFDSNVSYNDIPSTSSNYSYTTSKNKRNRDDSSMEAALLVSRSISSFIENRGEKSQEFKHKHIWLQIEKLFEQLDEDTITDLNFQFISQTYSAILEKREKEKNNK